MMAGTMTTVVAGDSHMKAVTVVMAVTMVLSGDTAVTVT
jgi:hypothetical protein